jgi:hypothetical protein
VYVEVNYFVNYGWLINLLAKSIFNIPSVGMFGVSESNPPCKYKNYSVIQEECLNLYIGGNLYQSDDSVSYTSKGNISPT